MVGSARFCVANRSKPPENKIIVSLLNRTTGIFRLGFVPKISNNLETEPGNLDKQIVSKTTIICLLSQLKSGKNFDSLCAVIFISLII